MIQWSRVPSLKLIIPFICGIILAADLFAIEWVVTLTLFPLLALSWAHLILLKNYKIRIWIVSFSLILLMVSLGCLTRMLRDPLADPVHISHQIVQKKRVYYGIIKQVRGSVPGTTKLIIELSGVKTGKWKKVSGKVLLQLSCEVKEFIPGMRILFKGRMSPLPDKANDSNPYHTYLRDHSIHVRCWLNEYDLFQFMPDPSSIYFQASCLRSFFKDILKNNHVGGDELSVAQALIFGADEDISKEIMEDYSGTGAIHILSVSGLHVGLVYILLSWITGKLIPTKKLSWIRAIILIIAILFYALLTGLSPSVLRSAGMFVVFAIGEGWRRKGEPINTLAVSAFFLLILDPFLIYDVGFQLSYCAVLGILLFYRPLLTCWEPANMSLNWIWEVSAVSVSSQITTFPLTLFYFGKFPLLFLITNLIVIPLSSLVLYCGLLLTTVFWIPFLSELLGHLIHWSTWLMNTFLHFMADVPYGILENVRIGAVVMVLMYLFIITLTSWLRSKKWIWLMYTQGVLFSVLLALLIL